MTQEQQILIQNLTSKLILKASRDFRLDILESMRIVYNSDTFALLCNPETGKYEDGSVCVYNDLKSEILTGTVAPEY